jgi:hypothetical protein
MRQASIFFRLIVLTSIFNFTPCLSQTSLIIKEDNSLEKLNSKNPKEGNSLLVFKTELELEFESSWVIVETYREREYYLVEVEAVSQSISLYNENIPTVLNFDINNAEVNSYPRLKAGDVKYFSVDLQIDLEYADITDNELKRGGSTTVVGPNVSDALVVIRLFPSDLELTISESNNLISKLEKKGTAYNVFLKMSDTKKFTNYNLTVKSDGVEEINVIVPKLAPKAVKFYRVKKPLIQQPAVAIKHLDIIKGTDGLKDDRLETPTIDYRKNLIGNWGGSLGDDKTYLEFSTFDETKKTVAGKLYANGYYMNFRGMVLFKNEGDYQASLNINSDDIIDYGATLDLRFNSGVLTGLWVDDRGGVKDFSAVRSASIVYDNNDEIRRKIVELNNKISGSWNAVSTNIYFDHLTIQKFNIEHVASVIFEKDNRQMINAKAKLLSKSGNSSLLLSNAVFTGIPLPFTISLTFNSDIEATLAIISDDASIVENFKLRKQLSRVYSSSVQVSDIYYVVKGKTYFHNTPDISSRTNKYIVKGQLPAFKPLDTNSEFLSASYTYRNITTKGFLLKSDLATFGLEYLVNTQWIGVFGNNQINITIEKIFWDENNQLSVIGYNILKGTKRALNGKLLLIDESQIQIELSEPGTDEWDGLFKISLNRNNQANGVWFSNNGQLKREFQLQKSAKK